MMVTPCPLSEVASRVCGVRLSLKPSDGWGRATRPTPIWDLTGRQGKDYFTGARSDCRIYAGGAEVGKTH